VGHQYDNDDEPWPIQIEDHNGQVSVTHSVHNNNIRLIRHTCLYRNGITITFI